jgi:hypothetical protein
MQNEEELAVHCCSVGYERNSGGCLPAREIRTKPASVVEECKAWLDTICKGIRQNEGEVRNGASRRWIL